jgi:hypothetical protein
MTSGPALSSSPLQYVKGPQSHRTAKEIISKLLNVKYHKGKAVKFQTHRRVVVLIPSNRVRGTSKHPRRVRNRRCKLWWDVHHTRPSPRGVPLDVRLPRRVIMGPDLLDQVIQRGIPMVHVRLQPLNPRKSVCNSPPRPPTTNLLVYICVSGPYGLCTAHRGPCIANSIYPTLLGLEEWTGNHFPLTELNIFVSVRNLRTPN